MTSMRLARSPRLALLLLCALLPAVPAGAASVVRVGSIPIVSNSALYCAMDYGALSAEGIEIQSTSFPSGPRMVEALAGGSIDLGFSATLSILQAVQQGLDLVIVAPAAFKTTDNRPPTSAIVTRKDSGITGPAQLRGKRMAVNALRGLDYLIAAEYLTRGGVSPRDVTWQELAYPYVGPALENARVDAAFVAEPYLTTLRSAGDGIVVLTTALDIIPGTLTGSYTALRSWAQSRQAVLDAFLRGLRRGVDVCERDPQKIREALVKHTGIKPALAQQIGLPVLRPTARPADLLSLVELARRHGVLVRDVDVERLLLPGAPPR